MGRPRIYTLEERRVRDGESRRRYLERNAERIRQERRDKYNSDAGIQRKNKNREWAEANPAKIKKYSHTTYLNTKEYHVEYKKQWRLKNPERYAAQVKAYEERTKQKKSQQAKAHRLANPEVYRARSAAYATNNRERVRSNVRNRRARKRAAEGFHTAADIERIRKLQRDKCGYCRTRLNGRGHVDHVVALAKGGSNWPSNLQLLCV